MPRVSVVMPVYNGERFLIDSIQSILNQSYNDYEFIIIDDGSSDGSQSIIERFSDSDKRIIYLKNENNSGIIKSLKRGLEAASGEIIARMDADDICSLKRFEKQVELFDYDNSLILCGCWFNMFFSNGKTKMIKLPVTDFDIKSRFIWGSQFAHPSVMFKREIENFGFPSYNEKYQTAEDLGLWSEILKFGTVRNLPEVLLHYRVHGDSITSSIINKNYEKRIKSLNIIYKKLFNDIYNLQYSDCYEHVFLTKPELLKNHTEEQILNIFRWTEKFYQDVNNSCITTPEVVKTQIVQKWNDFCGFHNIRNMNIGGFSENLVFGLKAKIRKLLH